MTPAIGGTSCPASSPKSARWPGRRTSWPFAGAGATHRVPIARPQERPRPGLNRGARRRRSNRPGNSQAKGLRAEGRSGKQRAGVAARPLTEGVSPAATRLGWAGESLRVHDRGGIDGRSRVRALSEVRRVPVDDADCRCGARRSTRCIVRSAPGWCRSPATRCRCSTRPASSPSICTPAPRPGCSMSRIWARCGSPAPTRRRRSKRWCRATSRRSAPRRMRYTLLLNDAGGILDDLMATRLRRRRSAVRRRQRRDARTADIAHLRDRLAGGAAIEPLDDRALLALQGPAAAAVLARLAAGRRADAVHDRAPNWRSTGADASSPARAIPARTGSRFRWRRPTRRDWPSGCWPSRR